MARKRTTRRKKTTSSSKTKQVKSPTRKQTEKRTDAEGNREIPLSDEDTLPSGNDPFADKDLGSPDRIPITVKENTASVEIITLDNDDTIVTTPEPNFVEMIFTVDEDEFKTDGHCIPSVPCGSRGVSFASGLSKITSSLKNQKLASEPECEETFEMTISIENLKKEPEDFENEYDNENSPDSRKNWPSGKMFLPNQIKKETDDEDDIPLSMLYSVKSYKSSVETKIDQTKKKTVEECPILIPTVKECPVLIPIIETEKIDFSGNSEIPPKIVSKSFTKESDKAEMVGRTLQIIDKKAGKCSGETELLKKSDCNENVNSINNKCQTANQKAHSNTRQRTIVSIDKVCNNLGAGTSKKDTTISILNAKIKEEPLSDSEDVTKKNDSANVLQEQAKLAGNITAEKSNCKDNSKASVNDISNKDLQNTCVTKEITTSLNSEVKKNPLVEKNVTSASEECEKGNTDPVSTGLNIKAACRSEVNKSSADELLGKESESPSKKLKLDTIGNRDPTVHDAVELINDFRAEELQELVLEKHQMDLKPVLENKQMKIETGKLSERKCQDSVDNTEGMSKKNDAQLANECTKVKSELPETTKNAGACSLITESENETKMNQSSVAVTAELNCAGNLSSKQVYNDSADQVLSAPGGQNKKSELCSDSSSVLPCGEEAGLLRQTANDSKSMVDCPHEDVTMEKIGVPLKSENKGSNASGDLISAENPRSILNVASGNDTHHEACSRQPSVIDSGSMSCGVGLSSESKLPNFSANNACEQNKDKKMFSPLSKDVLRSIMQNIKASTQGQQQSDSLDGSQLGSERPESDKAESDSDTIGSSKLSGEQEAAGLAATVKHESVTADLPSKNKGNCAFKPENVQSVHEYPDIKKCETENVSDDSSQSMDCCQPGENIVVNSSRKRRNCKRAQAWKSKKFKKEPAHNCPKQDRISEVALDEKNSNLSADIHDADLVQDEKVVPSKMSGVASDKNASLGQAEKNVSLEKPEKKNVPPEKPEIKNVPNTESNSVRLNDSIVEVTKLFKKAQPVASKGKSFSSREDRSKLKRKLPSPKTKSLDKESSLFDVENDPDIVSSKSSNKVQRFASRNAFLTKEMLPEKSLKNTQKNNKLKWVKTKKNEQVNFEEGHLLVKSPEIDDIHIGDSRNKIEVVVQGSHMSQSLDPRLNHENAFGGKHAKLNIEAYKERYRNTMPGGTDFQQVYHPVSTSSYIQPQQTVFQTNSFWNPTGSTNLQSSIMKPNEALRNPVFPTFHCPPGSSASFFNNSPSVFPTSQTYIPNQTQFNLPRQTSVIDSGSMSCGVGHSSESKLPNFSENNACEQNKDKKMFSPLSKDVLRSIMQNIKASTQGQQQSDSLDGSQLGSERPESDKAESDSDTIGSSKLSGEQEAAGLAATVKHESVTADLPSKAKGNCAVKPEKEQSVHVYPDTKKCETENVSDDSSQSMDCCQPGENIVVNRSRKRRNCKRAQAWKSKKFKKDPAHNCPKQDRISEVALDEKNSNLSAEVHDADLVQVEKVVPSKMSGVAPDKNASLGKAEKNVSLEKPEKKNFPPEKPEEKNVSSEKPEIKNVPNTESNSVRLNDSIVEVTKLSKKAQPVASKGKSFSSREDWSKLKRKLPSPKTKSHDKESSLFDVENDPDIVSSKSSNKVQRFASRNAFLTKEMLTEKSLKNTQKNNKLKWVKTKKNEQVNFEEGHLLVKSPEIDDIHIGDSRNKTEVVVQGGHMSQSLDPRLNHENAFGGKHAKLNIEAHKERYRNTMPGGTDFQQVYHPVSTSSYIQPQQTVFQTNSFWNPTGSTNLQSSTMKPTEALRNPVFSTFQCPPGSSASFFNNSPSVFPTSQTFIPNQTQFNLPMQSLVSPQNMPNIASSVPVQSVPPTPNMMTLTQNQVPPLSLNLSSMTQNVPVQPVRPLQNLGDLTPKTPPVQNLPGMTRNVPSVSSLSSTIPPLTFPPPPIRKAQYLSLSTVSSPPPVDIGYSSQLHSCFPSPEAMLPMQSFAPPLPSQPPPKIDVPPPPPDLYPPPPPASPPPPDVSPTKLMSLESSPSLSPPVSRPPPSFEASPSKMLQQLEFVPAASAKSSSFLASPPQVTFLRDFAHTPSSTPEQQYLHTPSSTPELLFSRPPSSAEVADSSTRDGMNFPKVPTPEVTSAISRRSSDSHVQGRSQKFSSKPATTFKDNATVKDLLFLMLSWNVSWLPQQIKNTEPPPIAEKVKTVKSSYGCYKDYYETYFPVLLLEAWKGLFLAWRQVELVHYFCNIQQHKPDGRLLEIECDTIVSSATLSEGKYPAEGCFVIIKFGVLNSVGSTKLYGYVSRHSVRQFVIKSDFSHPCLKHYLHQPGEDVCVLSMTIKTSWKCDKIDFSVLPRVEIVHSVRPVLKQYETLLNLRQSPLCKAVLSPDSSLCRVVSLSKTYSLKSKTQATASIVEEVAGLIIKPHPIPQVIVIEALPGTDKINTLVKLLHHLKSLETAEKKMHVLLCSRTNEVVDDLGCNLVLSQDEIEERHKLSCVRLGKQSDIHPAMRKFSFEELVKHEVERRKRQELEISEAEYNEAVQKCTETEMHHKTLRTLSHMLAGKLKKQLLVDQEKLTQKQKEKERILNEHNTCHERYVCEAQSVVIKTCDVVLCTVSDCHKLEVDSVCGKNSDILLDCCIIDDASQCTELETLLPLLYGISKLVLFGDPNISSRVLSKSASNLNYDMSYYQRVYSQVQIRQ